MQGITRKGMDQDKVSPPSGGAEVDGTANPAGGMPIYESTPEGAETDGNIISNHNSMSIRICRIVNISQMIKFVRIIKRVRVARFVE